MERGVHALLEASARAAAAGDWPLALDRAKEASRKERALTRHREGHGLAEHVNAELGYAVALNLAAAYQGHGMLDEALQAYQVLVRNKALHPLGQQAAVAAAGTGGGGAGPVGGGGGGWLRVDMGNVCYAQGKFAQAVKMYRMALDQVPNAHKEVRFFIHD
jgi:intraflagellar transport protein 88